jgi:hypothetical protein
MLNADGRLLHPEIFDFWVHTNQRLSYGKTPENVPAVLLTARHPYCWESTFFLYIAGVGTGNANPGFF